MLMRGPDPGDQGELLGARGPWPGTGIGPRAQARARSPGAQARGTAPGRRAGPALKVRSCRIPCIDCIECRRRGAPMVRGPDPGDQGELLGARGPWPGPGPRAQARGPGALARGPAPGRRAGPALGVRSCKMPGINVDAGDAPMDGWCGARARGTKANFWGPGARGRARGPGPRPGARGPGARARGPAPGRRAGPAGPRLTQGSKLHALHKMLTPGCTDGAGPGPGGPKVQRGASFRAQ